MNTKRFTVFRFLTLSALLFFSACQSQSTPTSTASPLTAALSEVQGQVGIKQPGAADFSPASSGMTLQPGGEIQTGDDGRVRLDLSTGTIIRVSPSSMFTLVSNQPVSGGLATSLKLDLGQIFIILKGGTADVTTPSGVASVRGSYLGVEVDPSTGDVYAMCVEGHCGASNEAGGVDFGGGQKTLLFHKDPTTGLYTVPTVGTMTPEDFQKWLDENPEIADIVNLALTALAPTPTAVGTEPPATQAPTTGGTTGGNACVNVTSPANSSSLPQSGPTTFSWDANPNASRYIVTIQYPNGATALFETTDTSITRYMESMPAGGSYSWDITALDASGNQVCKTDTITFSKEKYEKPPRKVEPPPECTIGQYSDPNAPCYCGNFQYPATPPPYCLG